jgi:hypothetical protein
MAPRSASAQNAPGVTMRRAGFDFAAFLLAAAAAFFFASAAA